MNDVASSREAGISGDLEPFSWDMGSNHNVQLMKAWPGLVRVRLMRVGSMTRGQAQETP